MERHLSLKSQSIWNSFGSAILLGVQWVLSVLLTRLNGFSDAGIFSFAMTLSNVFSTFANYGIRNYQVTDQYRKNNQGQYLIMRITASIIAILICILYVGLNKKITFYEKTAVLLYLVYSISIAISDVLMGSIQLKNHLEVNGYSNCIRAFLCFFLFTAVLLMSHNLLLSLCSMSVAAVIVLFGYDLRQYKKYYGFSSGILIRELPKSWVLYKEGLPVMITALIPMVITAHPRTVIQQHIGSDSLGYFSAVYTPSVILSTILPPMLIGFLPGISSCWNENKKSSLIKRILQSYGIVVAIVGIAYLGVALFGKWFLVLLYGESIKLYAPLLNFAIVATGLGCLCTCGNNILVAIKSTYIIVIISCVALIVTFALSLPLVLSYSIFGASYVLIIAYAIQAILQIIYLVMRVIRLH